MKTRNHRPVQETRDDEPQASPLYDDLWDDAAQPDSVDEPEEASDLDELNPDDGRWDAFVADDDERDPQPDYGDFWMDGADD